MKLFYAVNACSMAIHVLLEEIGKPYEGVAMDFAGREQYGADFVAKNPKSKVPTLERDDGSILTELPAIAYYLARANPEKNLLPPGLDGEVRSLELLDYMTATIHMRGYTRKTNRKSSKSAAASSPRGLKFWHPPSATNPSCSATISPLPMPGCSFSNTGPRIAATWRYRRF
jgi:glutathione S-transferase